MSRDRDRLESKNSPLHLFPATLVLDMPASVTAFQELIRLAIEDRESD
jgi:hypothetical protein